MAHKPRSRVHCYAVYLAVRFSICLVQAMPVSWALALARLLGRLAYHVDKRHRLVAADNLRHAFPELGEEEIDRRVRATYQHLFTMAVETVLLIRKLTPARAIEYVRDADPDNRRLAWELLRSNRPTLLVTGHVGNWEAMSLAVAAEGGKIAVVARRLDNPYLDHYMHAMRTSTGIRIVSKDGAATEAEEVLAGGGNLGLVGDQDAGSKGQFVEFFGRPASTFKSIALLALNFHAPILVLGCVRTGEPLRHSLFLADLIMPEEYQKNPGAVRAITQRYTAALEAIVRRHPEQYFWLHRRWKHEPKGYKVKKAA